MTREQYEAEKKEKAYRQLLNSLKGVLEPKARGLIIDQWVRSNGYEIKVNPQTGKSELVDSQGIPISSALGSAATGAQAAASSLISSWILTGEVDSTALTRAGVAGGFAGAQDYASDWLKTTDWGSTASGAGLSSGLFAGLGNIAAQVASGKDVDWGSAAMSAGVAGAKKYAVSATVKYAAEQAAQKAIEQAAQQGLSMAAQKAAGEAAASTAAQAAGVSVGAAASAATAIAMNIYNRMSADTWGAEQRAKGRAATGGTMGAVAGGTIGSIVPVVGTTIGAAVGYLVGTVLGATSDRARDRYVYEYGGNKQPVYYDEKQGKFLPNEVIGVRRYSEQNKVYTRIAFDPKEPAEHWMKNKQASLSPFADTLNEKVANLDNLPVHIQIQILDAMEGNAFTPSTYHNENGEAIDVEYRVHPNIGTDNGSFLNQGGPNPGRTIPGTPQYPENWIDMSKTEQEKWTKDYMIEHQYDKPPEEKYDVGTDYYNRLQYRVENGLSITQKMRDFMSMHETRQKWLEETQRWTDLTRNQWDQEGNERPFLERKYNDGAYNQLLYGASSLNPTNIKSGISYDPSTDDPALNLNLFQGGLAGIKQYESEEDAEIREILASGGLLIPSNTQDQTGVHRDQGKKGSYFQNSAPLPSQSGPLTESPDGGAPLNSWGSYQSDAEDTPT